MMDYMCPRCGIRYTFDEYIALDHVKMIDDDPDPTQSYGYTAVCGCGYRFHKDTPYHQTFYEFDHHITVFHQFFNKLTFGRLCKPTNITGKVSAVCLESNHDHTGRIPGGIFWELMVFANADREIMCITQKRTTTKDVVERWQRQLTWFLLNGGYIIHYCLTESGKGKKLKRDGWEFEVGRQYRRIFHSVKQASDIKKDWDEE